VSCSLADIGQRIEAEAATRNAQSLSSTAVIVILARGIARTAWSMCTYNKNSILDALQKA